MKEKNKKMHVEKMKVIENNHIKDMKTLDYKHEIDLLNQKDKSRQVDAQIEIDKNNATKNNKDK